MNLQHSLDAVLSKYSDSLALDMGYPFIREPFSKDFREQVGLQDDSEYVAAFRVFMAISQDVFRWSDYFEARSTAEKAFRMFYQQQNYPSAGEDNVIDDFIVSFFNEKIDECIFAWEDQHPGQEYSQPPSTEDDIDVVYLARVFSCAEMYGKVDDRVFCKSIGVNYDFEQLHMCCWFSSQITNGGGQYSRADANTSARTTYNRLRNPRSLLWIALIMGVDRNTLSAAVEEMRDKKTDAAKCSVVRKHVPFCSIYALFQDMIIGQEQN